MKHIQQRFLLVAAGIVLMMMPQQFITLEVSTAQDPLFPWFTGDLANRAQAGLVAALMVLTEMWRHALLAEAQGQSVPAASLTVRDWARWCTVAVVTYLGALYIGTHEAQWGLCLYVASRLTLPSIELLTGRKFAA